MRPIDADKVEEQAMYGHIIYEDGTENLGYTRIILGTVIKDAPTIDTETVKHGHWMQYFTDIVRHHYHCSQCGCIGDRYVVKLKFCPACGAKMDEVEK